MFCGTHTSFGIAKLSLMNVAFTSRVCDASLPIKLAYSKKYYFHCSLRFLIKSGSTEFYDSLDSLKAFYII